MSMNDFESACILIEAGIADFDGPKSEDLLTKAEQALGLVFPPTFNAFLKRFGCGDIAGVEFFGVIDDDFADSSIPDSIWLTLQERTRSNLPDSHIIVAATGTGGFFNIDCSIEESGENPVVEWWANSSVSKVVADDYGSFFLTTIREALD